MTVGRKGGMKQRNRTRKGKRQTERLTDTQTSRLNQSLACSAQPSQ